jgi:SAM-dependent methyltransferase
MFARLRRRTASRTYPARSAPLSESPDGEPRRLTVFRDILAPMKPGRLLDLGTGHGRFAIIAHELGWQVTAVDARTERMPMTPGIEWLQADVRRFAIAGFDCIAVLGLLYHLEFDDVQDLLRRCAGTPTILDTHTAQRVDLVEHGYEGRVFHEIPDATPERLAATQTASWGNATSWWPTQPALIRLMRDVGFRTILVLDPPTGVDRTFYLGL